MPEATTVATPTREELMMFGDPRVEKSTYDRYKGRRDVTDLIAIISSGLPRAYSHYYQSATTKTNFRCLSKQGQEPAICCQKLGEPTQRFGLVVFHYKTDDKGELLDPLKCSGTVKLWLITESKYEELSLLAKQWPLLDFNPAEQKGGADVPQHDLLIRCTEEKYQKMTIQPTPKAHWKTKPAWYAQLKLKENTARAKAKSALGRALSETEVMELFGMAVPNQTGTTANANELDLDGVLE